MRASKGATVIAQVLVVLGAVLAVFAALKTGPIRLMLFMSIGIASLVAGVALYLFSAIREFLRRRGVSQVEFANGDSIFREGEPGDAVYRLLEGQVEVVRNAGEASEDVVATIDAGGYFGEAALLSDAPRNATVRALTVVKVVRIAQNDFESLFAMPDFRQAMEDLTRTRA